MLKELPKDLKWCEHIHNWGNAFYFIDTHNPFAVSDGEHAFMLKEWKLCPICLAKNPLMEKNAIEKTKTIY